MADFESEGCGFRCKLKLANANAVISSPALTYTLFVKIPHYTDVKLKFVILVLLKSIVVGFVESVLKDNLFKIATVPPLRAALVKLASINFSGFVPKAIGLYT